MGFDVLLSQNGTRKTIHKTNHRESFMKKQNLSTLILVLVFLVGLAVLLYPTVSNWWNSRVQTRAIVDYEAVLSGMDEEEYTEAFAKADAYNAGLDKIEYPLINYADVPGYEDALDVTGTGIMGYITISRLNVQLPIYHGTSDAVLNTAVGHLEGTSLPVGGESTHCVLIAHRGLPSARLFTDLDKLAEGDTFELKVLNRTLTYQVDQIRIVEPEEIGELAIQKGEDYCTLVTCTPYGINTHRLLVRGHRIANADKTGNTITNEAYELDSTMLAPVVAAPLLLILLVILLVKYRKPKKARRTPGEDREENENHE